MDHSSGLRMQGRALDVAVTPGPDLRQGAVLIHEGVVRRNRAVGVDAHDLAQVRAQILRLRPGLQIRPLAEGHVQPPLTIEHDSGAVVHEVVVGRHGAEDRLDVLQPRSVLAQAAARHRRAVAALTGLGKAHVDLTVAGEVRTQLHIQQTGLTLGNHLRRARDGVAHLAPGADHAQGSRLFGHEEATLRQRDQPPRARQPLGHRLADHLHRGLDARRAGLALEGRLLVRSVGRVRLDGGAARLRR